MNILSSLLILLITCLLTACEQLPEDKPLQYSNTPTPNTVAIYRLAIHPLHNPKKLFEAYLPLVNYLNSQLQDIHIELEASQDYQVFEGKFRARKPELLLPNPWQTLQAILVGYHVIAMAGDAEDFKGIFIARKDTGIKTTEDIKGKVVSYPSPTALAAAIMPQYYLYTHGIDINRDIQNVYVGSQESSIMNAYLGKSIVGATWPPPWRLFQRDHPKMAEQLDIIWQTPALINNSFMVRDDVPDNIREQIKNILINLAQSPQGKEILIGMETANFYAANDNSYNIVQEYIKHFEQVVRPVEKK
ncbi:MAG: PhnD/SsuA/transferrin family substrate-binding protein [Methylococcaceae bacterium]|nr:PhnD/SsuA/transferrin family substrate-binding protein [Methylococcaceae bacterium]